MISRARVKDDASVAYYTRVRFNNWRDVDNWAGFTGDPLRVLPVYIFTAAADSRGKNNGFCIRWIGCWNDVRGFSIHVSRGCILSSICANPPIRHSFCVMKLAKIFFWSTPLGQVFSRSLYLILYEETVEQAKTGLWHRFRKKFIFLMGI